MAHKTVFTLEPLGALQAVVFTKSRKVLSGLGGFELRKMLGREHISLDLVDISVVQVSMHHNAG